MNNRNRRTLVTNVIKTVISYAVSVLFGYFFYAFLLNGTNSTDPSGAKMRTVLYSLLMFAFFVSLSVKLFNLVCDNESKVYEKREIISRTAESDYRLDYKAYFTEQVKKRIWATFIPVLLLQLPLLVNYAMVSYAEGFSIYTSPIALYKLYMPSMFVWELLGNAWFLSPIVFTVLYASFFLIFLYRLQKRFIPQKPSWVE